MKTIVPVCFLVLLCFCAGAQPPAKNVFIITLDGVRWQEVFKGADPELLRDTNYVQDTLLMQQQFGDTGAQERRRMLMPFFWSVLAKQGQLAGNRELDSKVSVANLYKISYPGYNEILTGYADPLFIPNLTVTNQNDNVLQFLDDQDSCMGQVAAFCSWNVFPFILNRKKSTFPINAGYEALEEEDSASLTINGVQDRVGSRARTRHDLLTFECAKNYIQQHQPRVLFLGLGEADVAAHHGQYDTYLQKIHQADAMIGELWYQVQTNPAYRNNTSFIITTDHGRGKTVKSWKTHGFWIGGSGETWLAMMGSGIKPLGEMNEGKKIYQKQVAATVAGLLGYEFGANHPVAKPIALLK